MDNIDSKPFSVVGYSRPAVHANSGSELLSRFVFFLLILLLGPSIVMSRENVFYGSTATVQGIFYLLVVLGFCLRDSRLCRVH